MLAGVFEGLLSKKNLIIWDYRTHSGLRRCFFVSPDRAFLIKYLGRNGVKGSGSITSAIIAADDGQGHTAEPNPTPPPNRYIPAAYENRWTDDLAVEIGDRISAAPKGGCA